MRIDFHQHVWTLGFRRALEGRHEPPYLRGHKLVLPVGGAFDVDPDAYAPAARIAELERAGLDCAVVSLAPTTEPTGELASIWNEEAQSLEPRLRPLAYGESRDGFAGAIVAAPRLLDDPGLLRALEENGRLLFVHPGPAPSAGAAWRSSGVVYAAQMLDAFAEWLEHGASSYPRLRVVFALLAGGAPFQLERLFRRGLHPRAPFAPNVWFETSSYGERALELSLQTFGAARLVFGSDAPIDAVAEARAVLARFGPALESQVLDGRQWAA
jgi:hypothetical protein